MQIIDLPLLYLMQDLMQYRSVEDIPQRCRYHFELGENHFCFRSTKFPDRLFKSRYAGQKCPRLLTDFDADLLSNTILSIVSDYLDWNRPFKDMPYIVTRSDTGDTSEHMGIVEPRDISTIHDALLAPRRLCLELDEHEEPEFATALIGAFRPSDLVQDLAVYSTLFPKLSVSLNIYGNDQEPCIEIHVRSRRIRLSLYEQSCNRKEA